MADAPPVVPTGYGGPFRDAPWWDQFVITPLTPGASEEEFETRLSAVCTALEGAAMASMGASSSPLMRAALAAEALARHGAEGIGVLADVSLFDAQTTREQGLLQGSPGARLDTAWTLPEPEALVWLPERGYLLDPLLGTELARPKEYNPDATRPVGSPFWSRLPSGPAGLPPGLFGAAFQDQLVLYQNVRRVQKSAWDKAASDRVGVRMITWMTLRALED